MFLLYIYIIEIPTNKGANSYKLLTSISTTNVDEITPSINK